MRKSQIICLILGILFLVSSFSFLPDGAVAEFCLGLVISIALLIGGLWNFIIPLINKALPDNRQLKQILGKPTLPWRTTYVGNMTTGVMHKAGCKYIKSISPANRTQDFYDRQTAINGGYDRCKHCKP